jgi:hypothetical protein
LKKKNANLLSPHCYYFLNLHNENLVFKKKTANLILRKNKNLISPHYYYLKNLHHENLAFLKEKGKLNFEKIKMQT